MATEFIINQYIVHKTGSLNFEPKLTLLMIFTQEVLSLQPRKYECFTHTHMDW